MVGSSWNNESAKSKWTKSHCPHMICRAWIRCTILCKICKNKLWPNFYKLFFPQSFRWIASKDHKHFHNSTTSASRRCFFDICFFWCWVATFFSPKYFWPTKVKNDTYSDHGKVNKQRKSQNDPIEILSHFWLFLMSVRPCT